MKMRLASHTATLKAFSFVIHVFQLIKFDRGKNHMSLKCIQQLLNFKEESTTPFFALEYLKKNETGKSNSRFFLHVFFFFFLFCRWRWHFKYQFTTETPYPFHTFLLSILFIMSSSCKSPHG